MNASREIERKFLVASLPAEKSLPVFIDQGYLRIDDDGSEDRVRRMRNPDGTNEYFRTHKSGGDVERGEEEYALPPEEFEAQWPKTRGLRIAKIRFPIAADALTYEIDMFRGELEGLLTVEVEFDSRAASEAFVPPAWFGPEVTADPAFKNKNLARHGLPTSVERQHTGYAVRMAALLCT